MPSDRLKTRILEMYASSGERDLFRALMELKVTDSDLWEAFDEEALRGVLQEPGREADLRKPVKNHLKEAWRVDRVAAEVPLPSKSSRRASKADIVGFKKKILGGREAYGVELKTDLSKGAFRQAFAQAKEYQRHCEYSAACFSPFVYLHFLDDIDHELRESEYKGIGIWVANTQEVVAELRKASLGSPQETDREAIFEWIAKNEY